MDDKIKLKPGTVNELKEFIDKKIKSWGFEDETLHERLLLLTEEVGELINACRKLSGMNVDENREIANEAGEELADVINMVFAVGIKLGVDIEKEFLEKHKKVDERIYKRTKKSI
jgi:NTP pyrophosphatase (non-canonical NTP hydrolase)